MQRQRRILSTILVALFLVSLSSSTLLANDPLRTSTPATTATVTSGDDDDDGVNVNQFTQSEEPSIAANEPGEQPRVPVPFRAAGRMA